MEASLITADTVSFIGLCVKIEFNKTINTAIIGISDKERNWKIFSKKLNSFLSY